MNDLQSLPKSLADQIQNASRLLTDSEHASSQGNQALAIVKAEHGLAVIREIASKSPEFAALIMAAKHGHRGIQIEQVEQRTHMEAIERRFMGLHFGTDYVPMTTTTRYSRTIRLI